MPASLGPCKVLRAPGTSPKPRQARCPESCPPGQGPWGSRGRGARPGCLPNPKRATILSSATGSRFAPRKAAQDSELTKLDFQDHWGIGQHTGAQPRARGCQRAHSSKSSGAGATAGVRSPMGTQLGCCSVSRDTEPPQGEPLGLGSEKLRAPPLLPLS